MNKNVYLLGLILIIASVVLPALTVTSFAGDVADSKIVYRENLFGPTIERVTLDSGAVTYIKKYP